MYRRAVCHGLWLQGSVLLLLHLKWRINTKQVHLIDRADWREEDEHERDSERESKHAGQKLREETANGKGVGNEEEKRRKKLL